MIKLNMEEEVICDFVVSKKRKKVWKKQIELLQEFIRVCEKYHLKYFFVGGSLLGIIRHNGFIPWDDDIDVAMLREDYDKLLERADEFKAPFFLQSPYNDKIFRGHAQLRNSNTTAILKKEYNAQYNQGIFIDIFPYDNVPEDPKEYKRTGRTIESMKKKLLWNWNYGRSKNFIKGFAQKVIAKVTFFLIPYKEYYDKFQKLCAKHSDEPDGVVLDIGFIFNRPNCYFPKKFFYDLMEVDFYGIKVTIPKEAKKMLRMQYGDYNKFVKNDSNHGDVFFDPDTPYAEYLKSDNLINIINNEKL